MSLSCIYVALSSYHWPVLLGVSLAYHLVFVITSLTCCLLMTPPTLRAPLFRNLPPGLPGDSSSLHRFMGLCLRAVSHHVLGPCFRGVCHHFMGLCFPGSSCSHLACMVTFSRASVSRCVSSLHRPVVLSVSVTNYRLEIARVLALPGSLFKVPFKMAAMPLCHCQRRTG